MIIQKQVGRTSGGCESKAVCDPAPPSLAEKGGKVKLERTNQGGRSQETENWRRFSQPDRKTRHLTAGDGDKFGGRGEGTARSQCPLPRATLQCAGLSQVTAVTSLARGAESGGGGRLTAQLHGSQLEGSTSHRQRPDF